MGVELFVDKRVCSLLELRLSLLSVILDMFVNFVKLVLEIYEGDMEILLLSVFVFGRFEGDGERDFLYGFCDFDDMNDGDYRYSSFREY